MANTTKHRNTLGTIEAFYSGYNGHDAVAAAGLYAPYGRHREVAQDRVVEGVGALRDTLEHFFTCFPDANWKPVTIVVEDDRAAVAYVLTGTLHAQLGPFEPHDQRLRLDGLHLFQTSPSGIVSTADYWDSGTFARQMQA